MDTALPQLDAERYAGQWVALDPATHAVVAADHSLAEAERIARERGIPRPLLLPVPQSDAFFVGVI